MGKGVAVSRWICDRAATLEEWVLSRRGLLAFRWILAGSALATGVVLLVASDGIDEALTLALIAFGSVAGVHVLADLWWVRLVRGWSADAQEATASASPSEALRAAGSLTISTAGIVLGLIVAFVQGASLTSAVRVAAVSLSASILAGIVLFGFLVFPLRKAPKARMLLSYLFTVTIGSLAFGVLLLAFSIAI
jgi:hypothetical protein